jgi:hypothetical protein
VEEMIAQRTKRKKRCPELERLETRACLSGGQSPLLVVFTPVSDTVHVINSSTPVTLPYHYPFATLLRFHVLYNDQSTVPGQDLSHASLNIITYEPHIAEPIILDVANFGSPESDSVLVPAGEDGSISAYISGYDGHEAGAILLTGYSLPNQKSTKIPHHIPVVTGGHHHHH